MTQTRIFRGSGDRQAQLEKKVYIKVGVRKHWKAAVHHGKSSGQGGYLDIWTLGSFLPLTSFDVVSVI